MGNAWCKDKSFRVSQEHDTKSDQSLVKACRVDELKDGQMREVEVGEGKVLLVRQAGQYHAIGAKCTHFGAPLSKGVLCNGHVRCPWHGACFNIETGDIEDYPGLDSIPKYETSVKNDTVYINATAQSVTSHKRTRPMTRRNKSNKDSFVIVGGGPAALTCAQTLRAEGFDGQITVVCKERHLPYDRSRLSKSMKASAEELHLRNKQFFASADIDVRLSSEAASVLTEKQEVKLADGAILPYTKLLIATGSSPRLLDVEGSQLKGIFVLRTVDDANAIAAAAADDKHVVILGQSFIGVETACFLSDKAKSVTVVGSSEYPLSSLGKDIGLIVKQLLEEHNITFCFKTSAKSFVGESGHVTGVVLANGSTLKADMCVLGLGVTPNKQCLRDSPITLNNEGFISVDEHLQTNVSGVFAAGDVTTVPLALYSASTINIQHWQMAHKQGQVAAMNMLGRTQALQSVPVFWTVIFGKSIRYAGYATRDTSLLVHKEEDQKLIVFYLRNDLVTAVASINFDPAVAYFAEMQLAGKKLTRNDISGSSVSKWLEQVKTQHVK